VGRICQDDDDLLEDVAGCGGLKDLVVSGSEGITRYGLQALAGGACSASLTRLVLQPAQEQGRELPVAPPAGRCALGWFRTREAAAMLAGLPQLRQLCIGLRPCSGGLGGGGSGNSSSSISSSSCISSISSNSSGGRSPLEQVVWELQRHSGLAVKVERCSRLSGMLLLEGAAGPCCRLSAWLLLDPGCGRC
jgi:hypothetical protein